MYETAPTISSDLLREISVPLSTYAPEPNGFHRVLVTCLRCLALLSDVMSLCLQLPAQEAMPAEIALSAPTGTSRAEKWKALLEELWECQTTRLTEVQALMEAEDDGEATFPAVLFTSAAGISANITYHTAMLLLLDHQPRTISLTDWHSKTGADVAQTSPFWHARRVCGIALNSDPEHTKCWDPCMIAAFSLAARRMTHPAQQNNLLACLDGVRAAGWRIDGLVRRLREEWGRSVYDQDHLL
jgi:hypothetical protein